MAEFERICENLEDYVPSDWRLTRFTGDFLILDLAIGITLVGDQRRKDMSADIIKVVNTALLAGGFSKAKLGKHAGSAHLFEIAKRPNLFIGNERIHEIFKVSPVLARQYEKVTYKTILIEFDEDKTKFKRPVKAKSNIEYYRLHPLTKSGLDQNNYVWMKSVYKNRYQCSYSIETGKPPIHYHGEDFWHLETE
jgi:hypothetical protein